MSNIPTKEDVEKNKNKTQDAAAKQRIADDVKFFTDEIVKAMGTGESSYSHPTKNVSAPVLAQLQVDFAPEWVIKASNSRTGCTVSWS